MPPRMVAASWRPADHGFEPHHLRIHAARGDETGRAFARIGRDGDDDAVALRIDMPGVDAAHRIARIHRALFYVVEKRHRVLQLLQAVAHFTQLDLRRQCRLARGGGGGDDVAERSVVLRSIQSPAKCTSSCCARRFMGRARVQYQVCEIWPGKCRDRAAWRTSMQD